MNPPPAGAATPPPRLRRGREDVLTAATALFHERGYDATSMSDIAARLGFTKAALYRHVTGKAELLRAITGPVRADVRALLAASAAGTGRPVDELTGLLRGLAGAAAAGPGRYALFWGPDGEPPPAPDAVCREEVVRRLADLYERAVAQGDVRGDIAPRLAARLLVGAVVGAAVERGGPGDGAGPRPSPSAVDVLLDGPVRFLTGGRA
ncbi:TetR/AcrR family transcriptional regulator [Streptomyces sp. NRRL B-1140]|uniref:TetR/AcrR family transcriptional regulator n=1 Tax=Streptomyces sp. NRRL B-1140 TaxID=1415549 RepID=UPI00131B7054|nr:TetR/AcrR family transcriptional regulator [Streptomyces sp. NRRL B-1140]